MNSKKNISPDYRQIYEDILKKKFPHKRKNCSSILKKKIISGIDIIELNKKIFGVTKETESFNQKYRSYNKKDILLILDYQKQHKLTNSQLANHFKLSRNTVAKWKKIFI